METLNYTEEQSLEMFDLMADLQEARNATEAAWQVVRQAQDRHSLIQRAQSQIEYRIWNIKEEAKLKECPYTAGQRFIVNHDIYDQIKIDYVAAHGGYRIDIRIRGRRKATKGWEGTKHTTVEAITGMILSEM
jgi:hypothetical protein